jgi:hypothetical protein
MSSSRPPLYQDGRSAKQNISVSGDSIDEMQRLVNSIQGIPLASTPRQVYTTGSTDVLNQSTWDCYTRLQAHAGTRAGARLSSVPMVYGLTEPFPTGDTAP